ncbi:copper resistance CopC family protein [Cohnella yongneupensis]|uniref:Copper resistance protein CopC n=1 Tax=Cohnella yongneupensis TaxID=425006 RepID=A0ABW0R1T1_9BACL
MNKNILKSSVIIVCLMLSLLLAPAVSAHSKLVSTTPGSKVDTEVARLTLTFNEAIEPVSHVTVTNEAGEEQPIQETTVKGKTMTAVFETPLQNGAYTVRWKIISADGHPASGDYPLEVKIPDPSPTPSASPSVQPSEQSSKTTPTPSAPVATAQTGQSASATPEISTQTSDEESSTTDVSQWLLAGAAIVLVIAVVASIVKRRKTS